MFVPILLGSASDKEHAKRITDELDVFGIKYEVRVISAHKVPEMCVEYVKEMNTKKDIVFITCAGRSNGLSGVIAGSSVHPVIACPPFSGKDDYLVNIHSTLQMPSDTPVLTVIDPKNAAICVARIFGLYNDDLREKVAAAIKKVKESFKA